MELLLLILIVIIAVSILSALLKITRKYSESDVNSAAKEITKNIDSPAFVRLSVRQRQAVPTYSYTKRDYIMTHRESELFRRLERIAGEKYYIFPQIHLSSLLNHQVKNGQNWRAALAKIQRKSVDFVLVNKETLKTTYAIELDDRTHDLSIDRQERDILVNEIFHRANIPLVRLRRPNSMSDADIAEKINNARDRLVSRRYLQPH